MFDVGLHFSLNDFWKVRSVAVPGSTLASANLRARTGASIVAIMRNRQLLANPKSMTVFEADDRIGLIGDSEQITAAEQILSQSVVSDMGVEWET